MSSRSSAASAIWSALWIVAERLFAAAAVLLLLPVLAAIALLVRVASRRSPFIAHRRVGRNGEEFWMLKVRTMWDRSRPESGPILMEQLPPETHVPAAKTALDPRITSSLALFLRRFSLDEVPQLLHVLTGRMRLVGPRPVTRSEWNTYYGASDSEVLSVAPGITGLWQVTGRNRLTYAQRRRLDKFYASHCSPGFDLLLLLRTPARVITGRDAC
ncbi:MAG TPA: sugar transferase [Bryobacteraceae bacterium]